jgi:hypothetical protein
MDRQIERWIDHSSQKYSAYMGGKDTIQMQYGIKHGKDKYTVDNQNLFKG